MATPEAQKEKKGRLSRLLGTKREKSPESPPTFPPDSAYASETPLTDKSATSATDIVPAEKDSEIANIDKDRSLGVRPSTGEVFDRDTGEVVTVVTTTTTTTTTTTRKPGGKSPDVQKDVQKDVQESTQIQPAINGTTTNDSVADRSGIVAEMPATPGTPGQVPIAAPVAPIADSVPDRTSSSNRLRKQSPGIPPRSNRRSGDHHSFQPPVSETTPETGYFARPGPTGNTPPLSPTRASNFSYPSRARDSMDGTSIATNDHPQSKSTLSDLRAAAKGIHVRL